MVKWSVARMGNCDIFNLYGMKYSEKCGHGFLKNIPGLMCISVWKVLPSGTGFSVKVIQ